MATKDQREDLDRLYRELNARADKLYKFVLLYSDYIHAQRDYGTGQKIGMIDVHTLTYIEENPGTTITELAKDWNKTKGAISQTVKRLVESGLVTRKMKENNSKTVLLYATEEGTRLSIAHKMYDLADIAQTTEELMMKCTPEEIDTFYKVIDVYIGLLKQDEK
ncbi:MarR family transcriptional regulator [Clostridium sp. KNHs216]|jgi:Transcriptional regulators|uniref:MarR family winged helix-turn-helix transcriptional regulator n=1 Tax=Eubacteriales TaxID=186802 RepID=UPI00056DBAC5|nr:MarR family transcriptional regulator [Clostridium sp. KNHs216]MBE6828751.1 MarR family transcriptional regulator [Oscillospiraceae bacterium]TQI67716.1 MarR family protein [Clostridium sp. KNHs216]